MPEETKCCKTCGLSKELNEFYACRGRLTTSCKPCHREKIYASRKDNPDAARQSSRKYYLKNQEEIKRKNDLYRKANHDRVIAWAYQWKKNNPDKARDSARKACANWRKNNPETARAYRLASHASRRGTLDIRGSVLKPLLPKILNAQKGKCGCCRQKVTKYHLDHIIPLSKGGDNSPRNFQILCAPCNIAKSNRDQIDFMRSRGFLL